MNQYGELPKIIGNFSIKVEESFFYLYLPVKLPHLDEIRIPKRLELFEEMVEKAVEDFGDLSNQYVYLTAKNQFVTKSFWGNRPGWHTDGFLTDDTNYIWCDRNPTIFNSSNFVISADHSTSLAEFEAQATPENNRTYEPHQLLKLNPFVVHKVAPVEREGMRSFVKISFSTEQYNLSGNSHNYLFDYKWQMFSRAELRNDPVHKEVKDSDFLRKVL